jgi:hypothetical protein
MAQITGLFDDPVWGFGFSLLGGSGPFPGSLVLTVGVQSITIPMLNFPPFSFTPESFVGIMSTDPIDRFTFSARRGTLVNSSEAYTNRPCFGGVPGEVCLASGSIQRSFGSAGANISEFFISDGGAARVSAPEPSTGFLVLTALAAVIAFRMRSRHG